MEFPMQNLTPEEKRVMDEFYKKFYDDGDFGGSCYSGWEKTGEDIKIFLLQSLRNQKEIIMESIVKMEPVIRIEGRPYINKNTVLHKILNP